MKTLRLKRGRNLVHHTRRYPMYALLIALLGVTIALTIVSVAKKNITQAYDRGREQIAMSIQTNLNEALRAFDRITLPGADIRGDILPSMRTHLYAAQALNEAMVDTYGPDSSVIENEVFTQIENAISEVEKSIVAGQSILSAREVLASQMTRMETAMAEKFEGREEFRSRTALK